MTQLGFKKNLRIIFFGTITKTCAIWIVDRIVRMFQKVKQYFFGSQQYYLLDELQAIIITADLCVVLRAIIKITRSSPQRWSGRSTTPNDALNLW